MRNRSRKIAVDNNIWISILIGRKLATFAQLLVQHEMEIVVCDQQLHELEEVLNRTKILKLIGFRTANQFLAVLPVIAQKIKLNKVPPVCRDPKDDFLLELARMSGCVYLVTGDKDILALGNHGTTTILTLTEFRFKCREWPRPSLR